jgi:hypothetical protein
MSGNNKVGIPSSKVGTTGWTPVRVRFAKVRADDDLQATAAFYARAFAAGFFLV